MKKTMQEITVYNKDGDILNYLTQWDKNVVIQFKDVNLSKATYVHFFNCNSKEAMVMSAAYKDGTLSSQVPNDILTEPHTITGYIWIDETNQYSDYDSYEHKSVYCFRIMVRKCPKPLNQIYEDQKEFITFDKILSDAKGYALMAQSYAVGDTSIREDENTDNAKYYKNEAKKSATSAKSSENEVTRLANQVDSNTEIVQNATNVALLCKNESEKFAILTESLTHGGTETRVNEETDNAKYYYEQSHNNSEIAKEYLEKVEEAGNNAVDEIKNALDMDRPYFQVNLSTGHLQYEGGRFVFNVNKLGHLEWGLTV